MAQESYAVAVNAAALALVAAIAVAPATGRAAEIACVFEQGVVIVPAEVMGVAGDYIFDTGTARTQLAETQAEAAGFSETALTGEVRVAGMLRPAQPVAVVDLDARTVFLATPIAGVIGVDVLRDQVVDVSFSPCRVWIGPAATARRFAPAAEAQMGWAGGLPVVHAAVTDGVATWPGDFTPATGLGLSLRLDDRFAAAPGAAKPQELYPGGVWRARLQALSFAGDVYPEVDTGLVKGEADGPAGLIGGPVLAHYRLRFDFPAGRLLIARRR
ncbi:MAG TPA: hypothetical protein VGL30_18435 [Phenylobacterium sp.]|jgi:hypothetical protein